MIRAILFDLGNVLVTFEERIEVVRRIVESFGGNTRSLPTLFSAHGGEDAYKAIDMGEVSHHEFWRRICQVSGIRAEDMPLEMFSALYVEHLRLIEPMVSLARRLGEHYPLFAVSNGDFGSLYVLGMLGAHYGVRFENAYVSSKSHLRKPELFGVVVQNLVSRAINPTECLYVDDIQKYVEAAQAHGMQAIRYVGAELFLHELRRFKIRV